MAPTVFLPRPLSDSAAFCRSRSKGDNPRRIPLSYGCRSDLLTYQKLSSHANRDNAGNQEGNRDLGNANAH